MFLEIVSDVVVRSFTLSCFAKARPRADGFTAMLVSVLWGREERFATYRASNQDERRLMLHYPITTFESSLTHLRMVS